MIPKKGLAGRIKVPVREKKGELGNKFSLRLQGRPLGHWSRNFYNRARRESGEGKLNAGH